MISNPKAQIQIQKVNESFIRVFSEEGIESELREYFTFQTKDYQFHPKYKAKLWDGKIRLYNISHKQLYAGLAEYVEKFAVDRGYTYSWDNSGFDLHDEFSLKEAQNYAESLVITTRKEDLNIEIAVRDFQTEAYALALRRRRILVESPTGSGKSLLAYLYIRKLLDSKKAKKILLVVPTIGLVNQMIGDFKDYSSKNGWDAESECHAIYQGKAKESNKPVFVSTWQSIYSLPSEFFKQFDAVIGDEAHKFQAKSLIAIMTQLVNAKYRMGMSGSLDDSLVHQLVLEGLFGPLHRTISTVELQKRGELADLDIKCILLKHSPEAARLLAKHKDYNTEVNYLISNVRRNRFISNLALSLNGNTIVFYQYVKNHGQILYDLISGSNNGKRKVYHIHGKVDSETRNEIRKIVNLDKNAIIVASEGTTGTGINIPNLHFIIKAMPSKARVRTLQTIGRALRIGDSKTHAVIFDIADDLAHKSRKNHTLTHFVERLKIYIEQKFKFKIYKINLIDNPL